MLQNVIAMEFQAVVNWLNNVLGMQFSSSKAAACLGIWGH